MTRQDLRCDHKWGLVPKSDALRPQAPAHQANQLSPWQRNCRAQRQASKSIWNLWGIL